MDKKIDKQTDKSDKWTGRETNKWMNKQAKFDVSKSRAKCSSQMNRNELLGSSQVYY